MEIYSDKKKSLKILCKALAFAIGGLILIGIINVITLYCFQYYFVPHILAAPAFIFIIYLYRLVLHLFIPVIITNEDAIKYFNVIWYSKRKWNIISSAFIEDNQLMLKASSGRIYEKIDLDEFSDEDIKQLIDCLINKSLLYVTSSDSE